MNYDDRRAATQTQLSQSQIYQQLLSQAQCDSTAGEARALVDEAVEWAHQRTKSIIRHMGEYTLHDSDHLFRVLHLMERLLPEGTVHQLSPPELLLLILSAFFHDIGMAPDEDEVRVWKGVPEDELPSLTPEQYRKLRGEFESFRSSRPATAHKIATLHDRGEHAQAELLESYEITEYIRRTHSDRARSIIEDHWRTRLRYHEADLSLALADICYSHAQDALGLLELDSSLPCGPNLYACLPFVGVVLRLADILDFDGKRTPDVLYAHLGVRHPVSLREWQKHRAVHAWTITAEPPNVAFAARCKHPAIEAAIRHFCNQIDRELLACSLVLDRMTDNLRTPLPDYYKIRLPPRVDRSRISPETDIRGNAVYQYREVAFELSQQQVVDILMGTKLYGDPRVALRELLQNAIDACKVRRAMTQAWKDAYEPNIRIQLSCTDSGDTLIVEDNGVGMDDTIVQDYFSKVGSSYYKSPEFFALRAELGMDFVPTSRFGIGVLACFMVAETLEVETKRLTAPQQSASAIRLVIEGPEALFWTAAGSRVRVGTQIKLFLRDGHPWRGISWEKFLREVRGTLPNPPFPVTVALGDDSAVHDEPVTDYAWQRIWSDDDSIKKLSFSIAVPERGLEGEVTIAFVVDTENEPVWETCTFNHAVVVSESGEEFVLTTRLSMGRNGITEISDHLEIEEGSLTTSAGHSQSCRSETLLSLSGIHVPWDLHAEGWQRRSGRGYLDYPFPIRLRLNITGPGDLDLNAARTEVLDTEKWWSVREALTEAIAVGLEAQLTPKQHKAFKEVWERGAEAKKHSSVQGVPSRWNDG